MGKRRWRRGGKEEEEEQHFPTGCGGKGGRRKNGKKDESRKERKNNINKYFSKQSDSARLITLHASFSHKFSKKKNVKFKKRKGNDDPTRGNPVSPAVKKIFSSLDGSLSVYGSWW